MNMRRFAKWMALSLALSFGCGGTSPGMGGGAGGGTGGAVGMAGAAAVLSVAGGCKLQGCSYGSYCNKDTGYCDTRKCSDPEGCPAGTVCNEGMNRCQEPPPPNTPNDFLPQDNVNHPPGQN